MNKFSALLLSIFLLGYSVDSQAQTSTHYNVTNSISTSYVDGSFCSQSEEQIKIYLTSDPQKSLDIAYDYTTCAQTGYTLGSCSMIEWSGSNITEVHSETNDTRVSNDGAKPFCTTWIKVRPSQPGQYTYTVRWVQRITQQARSCGPATQHDNIYEGTVTLTIYPSPAAPVITVETSPDTGWPVMIANGENTDPLEWRSPGGIQILPKRVPVRPYSCTEYEARYFHLWDGSFKCYSQWSNKVNPDKAYKSPEQPGYNPLFGDFLDRKTEESRNAQHDSYPFRRQIACMFKKSADAYRNNPNGWAGGLPKAMFDRMANEIVCDLSVNEDCSRNYHGCFTQAQMIDHVQREIAPELYSIPAQYPSDLSRWDSDYEGFITNAVQPCIAEIKASTQILPISVPERELLVLPVLESTLRAVKKVKGDAKNLQKPNIFMSEARNLLASLGNDITEATARVRLALTPPRPQSDIYYTDLENVSVHQVTINANQYFLKTNQPYLVSVTPKSSSSATVGQSLQYSLSVPSAIATIDENGLLQIHKSPQPTVNDRFPLQIIVKSGDDVSVGQFAIYDDDVDGDQLNDTYETSIGLNPTVRNDGFSDLDKDDLLDQYEALLGTNPLAADSDGDSYSDKYELLNGTNPMDAKSIPLHIQSVNNGNWSSPTTWSCYCIPTNTKDVIIQPNHSITVDTNTATTRILKVLGKINYQQGAKIKVNQP